MMYISFLDASSDLGNEFLGAIPIVIFGLIFVIWGRYLRKKRQKKINNAVKAKVIDIKVKEYRTSRGYLSKKEYYLTLEYLYNNNYVTGEIKSIYDFPVGSIIDISLYGDKVAYVLSSRPNNVTDDYNSKELQGNQIISFIGYFLLGYCLLVSINIILDYTNNIYLLNSVWILICIGLIIFIYSKIKKIKNEIKRLKSEEFEKIETKVIDIKNVSNGKGRKVFYPVVEYEENGIIKNKVLYNTKYVNAVVLNDIIQVYRSKVTREIKTEYDQQSLDLKVKIFNCIIGALLVLIIILIAEVL